MTLRGSETILLVEDEDQVRAVANDILNRYGYHVLVARNSAEAIALCETHSGPIHLLLTDVVMPQMSGPVMASISRPSGQPCRCSSCRDIPMTASFATEYSRARWRSFKSRSPPIR